MIETHRHMDIPANYDWEAFYNGNPVQRWWKRRIARIVLRWGEVDAWNGSDLQPGGKRLYRLPDIVDVGCGTSPISTYFVNLTGIDRDPAKVDWMRRWEAHHFGDEGNRYLVGDIEARLPVADACADVVLAIELAEHVDYEAFWGEISRIARPGATVIVATPDYASPVWLAIERLYKRLRPGQYCDDHITHYNLSALKAAGRSYGLEYIQHKRVALADLVVMFRRRS